MSLREEVEMLYKELSRRRQRRSTYSIRMFAKELKVSPAFLSQIMSGKRKLSIDRAYQIAMRCKWEALDAQRFVTLVTIQKATRKGTQKAIKPQFEGILGRNSRKMNDIQHVILSDLLHTLILELTAVQGFQGEPRWIAKRLNVPILEVRLALARLKSAKLLKDDDGTLSRTEEYLYSTEDVPSEALRNFHADALKRAIQAQTSLPMSEREIRGATFTTDIKLVPEIKKRIRQFECDLISFMESGERNSLFHFESAFFRMDRSNP